MIKFIEIKSNDLKCKFCGGEAHYLIGKKKTPCCSKYTASCPAVRKKSSEKIKEGFKNGRKIAFIPHNKGKPSIRKGKTYEEIYGEKRAKEIKEKFHKPSALKGRKVSEKTREKWKQNGKIGGIRKGAGRGIRGFYQGYYCDSTWELAWLIYQLDHNKIPVRNTEPFTYTFNNEVHKYYPDFIMDNIYYEIKGYKGDLWEAKEKCFPLDKKLIVLDKTNIKEYIDYSKKKFGDEFWVAAYGDTISASRAYRKKKQKDLCACGNEKWIESSVCKCCADKKLQRIDWDSIDLERLMKENNYNKVAVAKILGISNKTVKKQYLKRCQEKA